MCIRAIRNIWTNCDSSRECIIESVVIKTIVKVFIEPSNKKDLTETCLKALCAFLVNLNPRCAEQMRGGKDKDVYKRIVDLNLEDNKLAIRISDIVQFVTDCGVSTRIRHLWGCEHSYRIFRKQRQIFL